MTPTGGTDSVFARHVRRLRTAHDWTLQELATRSDLTQSSVHRIEQGKLAVRLSTAVRLAEALGVPLTEMLESPSCPACHDDPPAGFTCDTCGRCSPMHLRTEADR